MHFTLPVLSVKLEGGGGGLWGLHEGCTGLHTNTLCHVPAASINACLPLLLTAAYLNNTGLLHRPPPCQPSLTRPLHYMPETTPHHSWSKRRKKISKSHIWDNPVNWVVFCFIIKYSYFRGCIIYVFEHHSLPVMAWPIVYHPPHNSADLP